MVSEEKIAIFLYEPLGIAETTTLQNLSIETTMGVGGGGGRERDRQREREYKFFIFYYYYYHYCCCYY